MNFIDQLFTITEGTLKTGEVSQRVVDGQVAENTGLGYYSTLDEKGDEVYMVTHLASGFGLGPRFYFESDAQTYIETVAPLTDWTRTAKSIFEDTDLIAKMKGIGRKVVAGDQSKVSIMNRKTASKLLRKAKEVALSQN